MSKAKKSINRICWVQNPTRVLRVFAFTAISKPLNGSLPRSNKSYFLRLYPVQYTYKNGKETKEATTETYYIKGLKGALRHQVMKICLEKGLEVCHTSDKETDKHGNSLLPEGFHLLGACKGNGECIVHQVFGSKGNEGRLSVFAAPITSISQKSAKTEIEIQNVQMATENRICKGYDGNIIQDFGEKYFSGEFSFEIDVTRCTNEQVGLLIESASRLQKLGRGYNAGYGKIQVRRFQLVERTIERTPVWNDGCFTVKQETREDSLKNEVIEVMEDWNAYT